jgi:hypothetical protein
MITQRNQNHLVGAKEICFYCQRPWQTIKKWIKKEDFPAKKFYGRWESDKRLIDEWRDKKINEP